MQHLFVFPPLSAHARTPCLIRCFEPASAGPQLGLPRFILMHCALKLVSLHQHDHLPVLMVMWGLQATSFLTAWSPTF